MPERALILLEGTRTGIGQLYVQAAQRLGLRPITFSSDPTKYSYLAEDGFETVRVDTNDFDKTVQECMNVQARYEVVGITCASLDLIHAKVGKLCRHFGLPGPDPVAVERCCDKLQQRQLLSSASVPIPAFRSALNVIEAKDAAMEIGLPVIVKPTIGSGSSGVRLCRNVDELIGHGAHLLSGKNGQSSVKILIEEFAQGPYYSAIIMGNEVVGISTADFGNPPSFVYQQYTLPAELPEDKRRRIIDVCLISLRALGLGWGPTNIEFRWTQRGPVVIEVNPRISGTPEPQMVRRAYGIDLITEHIKLSIGEDWDLRVNHSQTAAGRFLIPDEQGILESLEGGDLARNIPGVTEVKFYDKPTTLLVRNGDYRDCIGHVIVTSPNHSQTEAILRSAIDQIAWSIRPV
ncbi:ATP-grasp domain-containing protein [Rhizobium grahamii]|uniref:Carbamoyl-phosphate synthase L chain ATP-binding protein n=1 Tax=Rhizobium grahamii CCGE 502 TaxID=990285 RepID=S3HJ84_9HYPH|nr:ATP-grasp domain-containing protein [Rhizobium grahamii]EPE93631.1 carbamoyl-phosphate synthase L chain ATP-binding protein [Rhizobium grahamii CCGE 502]